MYPQHDNFVSSEISFVHILYQKNWLNSLLMLQPTSNRRYCLKQSNRRGSKNLETFQLWFVGFMYIRLCFLWFIHSDSETIIWISHNFVFLQGNAASISLGIAIIINFVVSLFKIMFQYMISNDSFPIILHLHQLSPQASEQFLWNNVKTKKNIQSFKLSNILNLQKPKIQQQLPKIKSQSLKLDIQNTVSTTENSENIGTKLYTRPYLRSQFLLEKYFFSLCLTQPNFIYLNSIAIILKHFCALTSHVVFLGFSLPILASGIYFINLRCTFINILIQLFWQCTGIYYIAVIVYASLHTDFYIICALFLVHLRFDQLFATATSICHPKQAKNVRMWWLLCHQVVSCQRLTKDIGKTYAAFMGIAYFTVGATTCGLIFVTFFHTSGSPAFRATTLSLVMAMYIAFSLIMVSAANVNWKVS